MGSDAAGWLHQGMANRLALDMGLNMDPSVLSGTVALPPIEIELRRQIYWALYCHDKLSASYTGRVCTLLVCFTTNNLFLFFFWHHIILTFLCHIGLPGCRQQTVPLMCLGCLFAFSNWQWTIKGCFSERRGTVA